MKRRIHEIKKQNEGKRKLIGHVAVDSGQIVISDPCWLEHFVQNGFDPAKEKESVGSNGNKGGYEYSYNGACKATLSKTQAGQLNLNRLNGKKLAVPQVGVAVGTRYGDWLYPVYAYYLNGQIMAVLIDFYIDELEEGRKQ